MNFEVEKRIRDISSEEHWTQDQYNNDPETQYDLFNGVICIYISNFFTNGINFTYYIRGMRNVAMFCGGMSGTQAFNGAALFAVTNLTLQELTQPIWGILDAGSDSLRPPQRLIKSKSPIETNKWRYIFETGRLVWEKSDVDLEKLHKALRTSNGGPRMRKSLESEDAANKMAYLRGGSGRADSPFDEDLTILPRKGVIKNPVSKPFLKSQPINSPDIAVYESQDKVSGTHSNHATASTPSSDHRAVDSLDLQCFEQRSKQWIIPSNIMRYGMSDEWQANI